MQKSGAIIFPSKKKKMVPRHKNAAALLPLVPKWLFCWANFGTVKHLPLLPSVDSSREMSRLSVPVFGQLFAPPPRECFHTNQLIPSSSDSEQSVNVISLLFEFQKIHHIIIIPPISEYPNFTYSFVFRHTNSILK